MQIRQFNEEGINFKGNLPLFGENSHVLFEFPLYQIIAHLISEALNLDPVVAARLSTLILFQISAVLLLRINSVFFNKKNSLPLLVLYQFLPFGLLYGHSPLGEFVPVVLIYIATLLEAGATKRRKTLHFAFSIVIVSLAFLSKVTTAIALTPILFLNTVSTRGPAKKFLLFRAISSISIGLFLTSKWNDYADSLKVTNSYTKALASNHPRMVTWNLGTWDQRFDFGTWYQILVTNVAPIALNGFLLIILGILGLFRSRKANLAILLICVIAPILIFTNLYLAHLYYLCAIYGVIVLLTITLLDEYSINLKAEKAKSILVFFILVGAASSTNGSNSIQTILRHSGPPSEALKIKNLTNPGDTVLYLGCEWSAYLPYYSERDAIMVPSWIEHVRKNDFEKAAAVFLCDSGQGIMEKNLKLLNKDWRSVDGTIYLRAPNNKESP